MLYKDSFYDFERARIKKESIPFGTLSRFIEDNFDFSDDVAEESVFPQILIECEASQRESIEKAYRSAVERFAEEKNKKLDNDVYHISYPETEGSFEDEDLFEDEDEEPFFEPDYYSYVLSTKASESGICIYAGNRCSVNDPESNINPLVEPVKAALKGVMKSFPEARVSILLKYHFDFGCHYGNDFLWIRGNAGRLAAGQLDFAMRRFHWNSKMDYEKLLDLAFEVIDGLPTDWIEVFWDHVPKEDAELRARLAEKFRAADLPRRII